jgi:peroxiredoxin
MSFVFIVSCTNNNLANRRKEIVAGTPEAICNKYLIKGVVHGMDTGWIFISRADTLRRSAGKERDSTKIIRGKFEFTGTIDQPVLSWLGLQQITHQPFYSYSFFLDKGELSLELYKDSLSVGFTKAEAKGTRAQDEFNEFKEKYYPVMGQSNKIWFEKQKAERRNDTRLTDSLNTYLDRYDNVLKDVVIDQARKYPSSTVSAYLVQEYLTSDPDPDTLTSLYSIFDSSIQNTFYGRQILKAIRAGKKTMVGKLAPDFRLNDKNGNLVSLSSYKGKYTLIDFWASWCGPCRAENPNLVNAYNEFKEKDFSILSISLDDNKKAWLKAVSQDRLTWKQVSDLKGSKSDVKETYGIKSIPMNYLLDKDGRIIAKNLRGTKLQRKLREVIK